MFNKKALGYAAAVLCAVSLSACVGSRGGAGPREAKRPVISDDAVRARIAKMDTDKDGALTCKDVKLNRERLFQEADANGDHLLTPDEYATLKWHDKLYTLLTVQDDDEDGDGAVSLQEFEKRADPYFVRVDTNKDCTISFEEMRAGMESEEMPMRFANQEIKKKRVRQHQRPEGGGDGDGDLN